MSLVVKKKNLSFPVAVNNSFKVGPLVFLLQMFVIKENIMKRPIFEEFKLWAPLRAVQSNVTVISRMYLTSQAFFRGLF